MTQVLIGTGATLIKTTTVASPGESAGMNTGPAPLKPVLQTLLDNDIDIAKYRVVDVFKYEKTGGWPQTVSSHTGDTLYTDTTAVTAPSAVQAQVGDLLEIDVSLILSTNDDVTPKNAYAQVMVVENTGGAPVNIVKFTSERASPICAGAKFRTPYSLKLLHTITSGGLVLVKIQTKIDNAAGTVTLEGPGSLICTLRRPAG